MKWHRIRGKICALMVCSASTGMLSAAWPAPTTSMDVAIDLQPDANKAETAAWLGYILACARYVDDHPALYEQKAGPITPSFTKELTARRGAAQIYREMLAKDSSMDVPYFDELVQVDDSGYLSEYVWALLHQPSWIQLPPNLRLTAFEAWIKIHLPNHRAITKGSLRFVSGNSG